MVTSEGVDGHLAHIQGKAVRYWLAWIAGRDPGTLFLLQHVHIHRASPERRGGKLLSPGVESGGGPQLLLLWLPLTPVAQLSSYGAPATSVFPAIASPLRLRGGRRRISATSPWVATTTTASGKKQHDKERKAPCHARGPSLWRHDLSQVAGLSRNP